MDWLKEIADEEIEKSVFWFSEWLDNYLKKNQSPSTATQRSDALKNMLNVLQSDKNNERMLL